MKKIISSIKNKVNTIVVRTQTAIANTRGEGYVDSGV